MTRTQRYEAALQAILAADVLPPDLEVQVRNALAWAQLPKRQRYPQAYLTPCPTYGRAMHRGSKQCISCNPPGRAQHEAAARKWAAWMEMAA